ncbi:cyclic pyranopterin monophosphate synthase [Spirochaetia bacterium]|nr:cyclic pyranopterin monophosphate synthase [Spirochaetia bacterium]
MRDSYGREINYARISITDQCNLRCVYCMPAAACTGAEALHPQKRQAPQDTYLSAAEILRIGTVFADLGIHDLRVTGGEPLVRSDAVGLVRELKKIPGIRRVALTTNGQLLGGMAASLKLTGLDGINVSLDTLDAAAYRSITRGGDLALTLGGIDAALAAGFSPVKVNCVLLDRDRRNDALGIAALARDRDIRVRFIEMMPIGMGVNFAGVSGGEVRGILEEAYGPWEPAGAADGSGGEPRLAGSGPARYGRLRGFREAIGFISPLSDRFCGTCNRIRLSSTGFLRSCLHGEAGVNLRPALEQQDDARLRDDIISAVNSKAAGHCFSITADRQEQPGPAFMSQIGG